MKQNTPCMVSIALCTYNGEKNLEEQLDTLVGQTYGQKEIVIVDDCSSDATLEIIEKYRHEYPFIKVHRNELNLGYIKNFEKAISLCTGEYIALADQDDIWDLDKIKILVENIGTSALIYHDSQFINEEGKLMNKKLSEVLNMYEGDMPHFFMFNNCISGHSLLFSHKIVPDILPFDKRYYHDKWISFIASERGGINYIDVPLVKYRQHEHSITDILDLKSKKEPEGIFNEEAYAWLVKCKENSLKHRGYFQSLLSCFDDDLRIVKRLKLFYLLSIKADLIFSNNKKSTLSRINSIRKICFRSSHTDLTQKKSKKILT